MITLNTEQGLINVDNWDEVKELPGFVTDLNPSEHQLESIIGRYSRKEKINCGLSNCHTPHGKGYIVKTKKGLLTNIGHVCGKSYFGTDFETMTKQFIRDITASEDRNYLWSFDFQIEDLEGVLEDMLKRPRGAEWVYKKTRSLVSANGVCPIEIVRRITSMVRAGTNILTIPRVATQTEIEILEAKQVRRVQRPHIIEEPVAEIAGIRALYPENDLRAMLVLDLGDKLASFKEKDIDSLSFDELRHWAKWANSVENTLVKARTAITLGAALLSPDNLEPFIKVLATRDEIALFRSYLKGLGG